MGGIATLIARMSEWLIQRGDTVQLLVREPGCLNEIIGSKVNLTAVGSNIDALCLPFATKALIKELKIDQVDVIKAFDTKSAWIASLLAANMQPRPKTLCGNYGVGFFPPRHKPFRSMWPRLHARNVVKNYTPGNLLLMGEEHRVILKHNYGPQYDGIVWPLPIDASRFEGAKRSPKRGQIVSIGRLSPMKEYNLYMIDIVSRLAARKECVEWHVYGDGPFEKGMRKAIADKGLTKHITLHGGLDYRMFEEALREAWVFVGMGTAAVEAGVCGVPTVVAMAYDLQGKTYGPLQEWRFGNVGDMGQNAPSKMVEPEIARILDLADADYTAESQRVRAYALQYDREKLMRKYMEIIASAAPAADLTAFHYLACIYSAFNWTRTLLSTRSR